MSNKKRVRPEIAHLNTDEEVITLGVEEIMVTHERLEEDMHINLKSSTISLENQDTIRMSSH